VNKHFYSLHKKFVIGLRASGGQIRGKTSEVSGFKHRRFTAATLHGDSDFVHGGTRKAAGETDRVGGRGSVGRKKV